MFSGFSVMAGIVIVGDSRLLGKFKAKRLGFFEEHEAELEFLFLEKDHGDEVAEFTEPDRGSLIFLTMDSICIFIYVKQLFIHVKGFLVL